MRTESQTHPNPAPQRTASEGRNLRDKVIVALDYEDPERAFRLVDELGDQIAWYKVGPVLFTRSGLEIVDFLQRRGKRIFLDLKLHDTPHVVAATVKQLGDLGAEYATVHCSGGMKMLEAAGRGCRGSRLKLFGVTVLTSQPTGRDEQAHMVQLVKDAVAARLAGVLCSAYEIEMLRAVAMPGFRLIAAGIRLPGEEVFQDDQARVSSPVDALNLGADQIIVGRPITLAREPREVLSRLLGYPQ